MRTVTINSCSQRSIVLGIRGENEVSEVVYDFTDWYTEFGEGSVALLVKRPEDIDPYPVVLDIDTEAHTATWTVTQTDIAYKGRGECEWVYYVGDQIAKSAVFRTFVERDIGEDLGEIPEPYESWVQTLTELGAEANTASDNALDYAERAESAKDDAEQSANDAQGYASSASASASSASGSASNAKDSEENAQASAESASASATQAEEYRDELASATVFNVSVDGDNLIFESRGVING